MQRLKGYLTLAACATCALGASAARADVFDPYGYEWRDDQVGSEIGVGVIVGGGVSGFTDKAMREVTNDVQGLWNMRATFGTRIPIGLDVAYVGTASNINALTGTQSGTLVGTTLEGALRFNVMPHYAWNPYVFAGLGWQRYDVTGARFAQSDIGIADRDNLLEVPLGGGLQYRNAGFMFDLHGVFRATTDQNLVLENPFNGQAGFVPMHTWEASANIGFEL
jgi:hypothetical protein